VKFVFNEEDEPAAAKTISLLKGQPQHVSLVKKANAAAAALAGVKLSGLLCEVILLMDTSASMNWAGREYYIARKGQRAPIYQLLERVLGWALNVDANGTVPVIRYGGRVADPVDITADNYLQAEQLLQPIWGGTPMTEAFQKAMALAAKNDKMTIIFNLTDGDPNSKPSMDNAVIGSSTGPVMLKNLALNEVPYLEELDDMPSLWEIRKDANDKPVLDGDEMIILDKNTSTDHQTAPRRFIDNVDSKSVDPFNDTDEVFAAKMTDEIGTLLEVWGRTGILTGVPGVERTIF